MKKLILAVCLVFMVGVGFAKDYFSKMFATDTFIATIYDDGKVKYALTEEEIAEQIGSDSVIYFNSLIDYLTNFTYGTKKIESIYGIKCIFAVKRIDDLVYLRLHYFFYLMTYDCEGGISLKEKNTILDKLEEVTLEAWESLEDPIIDEIKKGL